MKGHKKTTKQKDGKISRRDFMGGAAAAVSLATLGSISRYAFAAGSDEIKIGLIGCGGRGTGATSQVLLCSKEPVKLWAMGDLFQDRIDKCLGVLQKGDIYKYDRDAFGSLSHKMDVPPERQFLGFDSYKKVLDSGVDLVLLVTSPHFRPEHFEASIAAGKHVFMEKPVAVDPVGIRRVLAAAEVADKKKLSVVAGTQRRHAHHYREIIKRIHRGDIGKIVSGQIYFCDDNWWGAKPKPEWSDMEYQCRNWYYFVWNCGDHIVEQHVHNIDVMNWALQAHPIKAFGMGGRAARTGIESGNIYDHFSIEFEYPNGVRVFSMCRQTPGCSIRISERVTGTKGSTYTDDSNGFVEGENPYKYEGSILAEKEAEYSARAKKKIVTANPYVQEHADLIASIRGTGEYLNEGKRVAESTLSAIMGRMSAYTGREISWKWVLNKSQLDYRPPKYEFGDLPVAPAAVPGKTKLI